LANGDPIEVFWPFSGDQVANWAQAEAIWYVTFGATFCPPLDELADVGNTFYFKF
jgi:NADH:ubiquinone oxidoreductase subunit B-like Fe-S oxidoreductase